MQLCHPLIIKYKYNANFNIYCFKFSSRTLIKLKQSGESYCTTTLV